MMRKFLLLFAFCTALIVSARSYIPESNQSIQSEQQLKSCLKQYFCTYRLAGYQPARPMDLDSFRVDDLGHTLTVYPSEAFISQPFTLEVVKAIYDGLQRRLPAPWNAYKLLISSSKSVAIEDLIPNILRGAKADKNRLWGDVDYRGLPWVSFPGRPYSVSAGLQGRHLYIYPSHGCYVKQGSWQWQRPRLYCTTEDLFTQSFVYPFLFPMLEKAGAIVYSARERDIQTQEALVDNDSPNRQGRYEEQSAGDAPWAASPASMGFASVGSLLTDTTRCFSSGTYRSATAVSRRSSLSSINWTPRIPRTGSYAVYVSYKSLPNSVPDARYTIFHRGGRTTVRVNQQMGGGVWVYLGTYEFAEGSSREGRVQLTNQSDYRGVVTADAVRFGGGVGRTERGSAGTSGLPAFLEAARYAALWTAVPDSLINTEHSTNDYADDLRTRGNLVNYLTAGSPYVPSQLGGHVPFELSLALHSDAGFSRTHDIIGSLSISTSVRPDSVRRYPTGMSREASSDLARLLLTNLTSDLSRSFRTNWTMREHYDRNYAETRMPNVPSAILEMLSHQNFMDMRYGHDPFFKFTLARSVYATLLRYVNYQHSIKDYTLQPLPPRRFVTEFIDAEGTLRLTWAECTDTLHEAAPATGYIVYTKVDDEAFDAGQLVASPHFSLKLSPGRRYSFKVTAVNAGGESFPTEELAASYVAASTAKPILIVNGFDRLSGPAYYQTADSVGFDLEADPGVPYLYTTAFCGRQLNFQPAEMGRDGSAACGHSGRELEGKLLRGNTFDFPEAHGRSIAKAGSFSFCSVGREAFEAAEFRTSSYAVIDYIAGLQADRRQNFGSYPALSAAVRAKLSRYLEEENGRLLLSGSYLASDAMAATMATHAADSEAKVFLKKTLKVKFDGTMEADSLGRMEVEGIGRRFSIHLSHNADHYGATHPDAILPASSKAFAAMAYSSRQGAAVAYAGHRYRTFTMAFPLECIKEQADRDVAMKTILAFLLTEEERISD